MKIQDYKKRFDLLLESKMGNVKPLINEDDYPGQSSNSAVQLQGVTITAPKSGMENYKDVYVKKDGTIVLKKNIPQQYLTGPYNGGCFAIPLNDFWNKTSTSDLVNVKELETDLKKQISTGTLSISDIFKQRKCSDRKIPTTEEDLLKPGYFLKKGDSGPLVKKLQKLLINYAEGYANMLYPDSKKGDPNFNPIDGVFGAATFNAVKQFQVDNNISPQSGIVGSKTWAAIKDTPIKTDWDQKTKSWIDIQSGKPAVST